jgi:HlyD family secretion protein
MKRWLIPIIVIAVLVGGYFALQAYRQSRLEASFTELQTVEAAYGPLTATVGATGTVRANQFAMLTFQTSGTVELVAADLGDQVQVDEVLAKLKQTSLPSQVILAQADLVSAQRALDDLLYSDQAWAAAQQALAQAKDALKDAEYMRRVRQEGNRVSSDTLDATRANLVLAEYEVDRAQDEFNMVSGRADDDPIRALAVSKLAAAHQKRDSILRNLNWYTGHPTELDQALLDADVAIAEARLADAEREWERLKDGPDPTDIAAAEARVAAAQASSELSMIKTPFSGTITSVEIKPSDQVSPGTLAFGLADLSHLFVDVDVSEIDINRVRVGQPVTLNFDAVLDKVYQGEVVEISMTGNIVQGVVNFKVTVELEEPDEFIKPGMTAAVSILVSQIDNVLLVPNRAVRIRDGQRVVYVLHEGTLAQVDIELGVSSETYSQVLDGDLQEGDLIVINPPAVFDAQGGPPGFVGHPRG